MMSNSDMSDRRGTSKRPTGSKRTATGRTDSGRARRPPSAGHTGIERTYWLALQATVAGGVGSVIAILLQINDAAGGPDHDTIHLDLLFVAAAFGIVSLVLVVISLAWLQRKLVALISVLVVLVTSMLCVVGATVIAPRLLPLLAVPAQCQTAPQLDSGSSVGSSVHFLSAYYMLIPIDHDPKKDDPWLVMGGQISGQPPQGLGLYLTTVPDRNSWSVSSNGGRPIRGEGRYYPYGQLEVGANGWWSTAPSRLGWPGIRGITFRFLFLLVSQHAKAQFDHWAQDKVNGDGGATDAQWFSIAEKYDVAHFDVLTGPQATCDRH
jgi:hypothetical protein